MDNMKKQIIKNLYDIIPVGAHAKIMVEEGQVEAIIDGYMFNFTVHEYSDKTLIVMLDSDTRKARNILKKYGATFTRKTLDEIQGDEFKNRILDIYSRSNSKGGMGCSWTTDDLDTLEYKEL